MLRRNTNKLRTAIFLLCLLALPSLAASAQTDSELVKLGDYFSKYYQYADELRMSDALADDFHYFTNIPCSYKDCATGATKANYISGIVGERGLQGFTVESISMKYIAPINGAISETSEPKASFYCILETEARGTSHKWYSVIDYYFRKVNGSWKITKIENRIINK
jgi:hypothetical protein